MNIWFISKYASPPKYSKMPSRLFHLANEISKLDNNVLLITSDSNHFSDFPVAKETYNNETIENVQVKWLKTYKYYKTASFRRIISWFDFELKLFRMKLDTLNKPDVVHISSLSIFSIVYGYYLKLKYNCFLVFEIRDIWPLTMTEEGGFARWHPLVILIGFVEKFGYKKADLIVGTMPNLKAHVFNVLGSDKPFYCLPLGFNPLDYSEVNVSENNPFLNIVPKEKKIIGYAGSMGITNALETFIETIKLMKDISDIHFLLVGSGDLRLKYVKELEGFENVTFLDRIDQNQVKYFLYSCDILYLSTKNSKVWDYGQSMNKVVEYMLASKPIIASFSGFPSMINEASCGDFVSTTDPYELKNVFIKYTKLSKSEIQEIGRKGKTWICENRQYSILAKDYINILRQNIN